MILLNEITKSLLHLIGRGKSVYRVKSRFCPIISYNLRQEIEIKDKKIIQKEEYLG